MFFIKIFLIILCSVYIFNKIIIWYSNDKRKIKQTENISALPKYWNIIKQTEVENGVWKKEGEDIPTDREVFIASKIIQKNENGNKVIITRWIDKKDALKCIKKVLENIGE